MKRFDQWRVVRMKQQQVGGGGAKQQLHRLETVGGKGILTTHHNHPLTHSPTHSLTHPLTHSLTHSKHSFDRFFVFHCCCLLSAGCCGCGCCCRWCLLSVCLSVLWWWVVVVAFCWLFVSEAALLVGWNTPCVFLFLCSCRRREGAVCGRSECVSE